MARGGQVHNANDLGTGMKAWYSALPPITRAYMTVVLVTTLAGFTLAILPLKVLYLDWTLVVKKLEIWRLVTNFFILDKPSFRLIIFITYMHSYMCTLERETFQFEPADYVYMLMFNAIVINVAAVFMGPGFYGIPFVLASVYVWSKNFREAQVSFFGLFKVKAFYVPFVFMGMDVLMGMSYMPHVIGISTGHLHYFFRELYPVTSGNRPLATPHWLKRKCADWGLGRPPVTGPAASAAAADPGFRAFVGRGQRLGTDPAAQ
ncbi:hypothetical protein FOA52_012530 [Chlamydomonas sp. UWO 241]|nr:hypothetical protein FOA52_012530 [Chlamydomonas sp. UWO 241]